MKQTQFVYKQIGHEMLACNMDTQMLSEKTGIPYYTLRSRFRGESSFTLDDAIRIHKVIGTGLSIEQLFERDDAL